MSSVAIPKTLGHIWIGPRHAPTVWMDTWKEKHPDWEYTLYDNDFLVNRKWRCQKQILRYYRKKKYEGVADLMRYEILFERGGFLPPADSTCRENCDEIFSKNALYSVWENEEKRPGYLSPFCASTPHHPFLGEILDHLSSLNPQKLRRPWKSVGNRFLGDFYQRRKPQEVIILPSFTFNPRHLGRGLSYDGDGKVYADQHWGTTTNAYRKVCQPSSRGRMKRINQEVIKALSSWLE